MMRNNRIYSTETVIPRVRPAAGSGESPARAMTRRLSSMLSSLGVVERPRILKAEIIDDNCTKVFDYTR